VSTRTQRINPLVLVCLVILFVVYLGTVFNAQVQLMEKVFLTIFFLIVFVSVMMYESFRINEEERHQ